MPQSLSSLLTHLVFSTKNREHWLKGDVAAEIHPYHFKRNTAVFLNATMSLTTSGMSGISKSRPYRPDASRITDPARWAGLLNQAPLVPENGQTLVHAGSVRSLRNRT